MSSRHGVCVCIYNALPPHYPTVSEFIIFPVMLNALCRIRYRPYIIYDITGNAAYYPFEICIILQRYCVIPEFPSGYKKNTQINVQQFNAIDM